MKSPYSPSPQTRRRLTVAVLLAVCSSTDKAQGRAFTLPPASSTLDHEFSRIGSLRELADGRLLVTDTEDQLLLVVDLGARTARPIASKGAGPGEYRNLGKLVALGGDTTLMGDAGNQRALVLHRDAVIRTLSADDPMLVALDTDLIGADANGRIVARRTRRPADPAAPRRRDEVALVAYTTARTDTIALVRALEMQTVAFGTPPNQSFRTSLAIMSSPEDAAIFPSGDIAVALQDPYRVDWYLANGQVRRGPPIERSAPRVDDAERQAWKRRYEEWSGRPLTAALDRLAWAEFVTPFQHGGLTALPDGTLLLAREPWSGGPEGVHDVVDRNGARVGTLRLQPGSRVVGTGRGAIYVASRMDDGTERLARHPWP